MSETSKPAHGIAIIGMAGRFPKARNVDVFWKNLCTGVEGITFFLDEELAAAGVAVPNGDSHYVKARGVLEDADLFDAAFFGMNPKEAEITDPQHRVFLECAWEALESAGWDSGRFDGAIGVFAGMSMNTYVAHNLASHPELVALLGDYQVMLGNDKDFLPTRVSYKLNLRGPSLNIQTACSTSLVAVCVACQHLLNFQCDMALAGGVSISFPQKKGHFYREGGIASPDGHCRAFDAKAAGTVAGEGAGIVVLKRLDDALADGDSICAVIKGFAINNDGSAKVGYTAPSVEGQAEVIAMAQAMSGVGPETISYVEAHGTGTPLGDPIEIEGLTKAFRAGTEKRNFCAVGSVKSNIGHLDTAAGVAGLIKTVLALQHKQLPPTLCFESPNPRIDFAVSPFFVNAKLTEWRTGVGPRRAGVSSFGIGGTNAHVVLEEAPVTQISKSAVSPTSRSAGASHQPVSLEASDTAGLETCDTPRRLHLILLSAKTATALDRAAANLAEHLKQHSELELSDVAYTLQMGRREFEHRRFLVSHDIHDAASALSSPDRKRVFTRVPGNENPPVVFMFPGQGAQHANMGRELYETEPVFREGVDACCDLLEPHLGLDLRTILFSNAREVEEVTRQLAQTVITQPVLFVVEYALAKLWMSWGVKPEAMIGHSIGEYVAACLAGVFSCEDALRLVAERGRLMQQLPGGTMLAVRLPECNVLPLLTGQLTLATVNGPASCVVSGPSDEIEKLRSRLVKHNVAATLLQTSHAFHSAMMEPILAPFTELVRSVKRHAPEIPFVSNLTGTWISAAQATDPSYWATHLRRTVRFADGLGGLFKSSGRVLLEVGPGQTLSNLAKQHPTRNDALVLPSLRRANESPREVDSLLTSLGELWLAGVRVDWAGFHAHKQRRRVRLPTYPFERKRFWVVPTTSVQRAGESKAAHRLTWALEGRKNRDLSPLPEGEGRGKGKANPVRDNGSTREARVIAELTSLLAELSGLNLDGMDRTTTFTEMGFESLFLAQASLAIEKQFGVRVAFRQLLEGANSLDGLADYIEGQLPPRSAGFKTRRITDFQVGNALPTAPAADLEIRDTADSEACATAAPRINGERRLKVKLADELVQVRWQETQIKKAIPVKSFGSYPGLEQGLNALCLAYICDYFKDRGVTFDVSRRYSVSQLKSALQIRPSYEKFLQFMLRVLVEDGIIHWSGSAVECLRRPEELPDSTALHARLLRQHPAFAGLLDMLRHCARHYRAALAGDILGVSVLLPDGHHDFLKARLQAYVDEHKHVRRYERLAKELVLDLSRKTPLRILEVGGGGGDLTWQLVPELAGLGCEYHFTDIGRTFVQDASKEAARRGLVFMKCDVLDISKDPVRQGFDPGSFEVVLGLNVVHATARVNETLAQLKQLLVPGGLVCLVELSKYHRWDTMIIGLAEGWWLFDDAIRKDSPLLELAGWEGAFQRAGFASVAALPFDEAVRNATDTGLILAQWQPEIAPPIQISTNLGNAASVGSRHPLNGEDGCVALSLSSPHAPSNGGEQTEIRSLQLTPAQSEVWFASHLSPDASCAYNDSRLLRFRGLLQLEAMRAALQKLVERHQALRTIFSPRGDSQQILPRLTLDLPLMDWSNANEAEQSVRLAKVEFAEASRPFDFVNGPLIRVRLVRLAAEHHVLFLTIHHIVCDGHSWGIVLRDLAALYSAESHGASPQLEPPMQFCEFACEGALRQNGCQVAEAEVFWIKKFSDGAPTLDLPTDQSRPSGWTFRGAREYRKLGSSLSETLKRLSVEHDCTLFTTLLAAYWILLHRLADQDDLVVGIPTAERATRKSRTLVGHCVNFLPVRLRCTTELRFVEFLAEVKQTFLAAYEHRDFTLGTLIQKLNLPRDQSRMPLVSVTFNFDRLGSTLDFAGLETEHELNAKSYCSFDLSMNVTEADGELQLDCRYNTSLFAPEAIRRWLGYFQTLLEGIVAGPQVKIGELPLLAPEEERQILVEWNDTRADFPRNMCLHELFEEQVERTPDAVAVVGRGESLTYRELNRRADQLAARLGALGVGPEEAVGVCLERTVEMVVALLSILKAGGAYVPLDPAYPSERLAAMLENASARLVLTQRMQEQNLKSRISNCNIHCIEDPDNSRTRTKNKDDRSDPQSSNLAYVIHTSGSMGVPKGVAIEHRSAVNFVQWARQVFTPDELAGVLFSTSICFDLSVFELFVTLSSGGKVILAQNALELLSLTARNDVTLINTVPSAAAELVRLGAIPPSVRVMNLAGEPLKPALVDQLYALGTIKRVHDLYGPTETTTYSTWTLRRPGARATVGHPIANTQVFILDANRRPVPIDVAGELCIGGEGVARGYMNQSGLTEELFVLNPVGAWTALSASSRLQDTTRGHVCPRPDRLYLTGDRARWLPDGSIELLGRLDHQVKIRGFRVEPGEIEAVLSRHPLVAECVIVAREDVPGDTRLVSYVVPIADQAAPTAAVLQDFLKDKLPDHMMPRAFVFLDALPRTPNGKLDRRALPVPDPTRPELQDACTAPTTPTEEALAEIWRDVLALPQIGVRDNFFQLGGHSLLVTRVLSRVHKRFGIELPIQRFFELPTIAALAAAIEEVLVEEIRGLSDDEASRLTRSAALEANEVV